MVAYFQMEAGSKPVIARGEVRSTYRDYVFYFSSLENRAIFEVSKKAFPPMMLPTFLPGGTFGCI